MGKTGVIPNLLSGSDVSKETQQKQKGRKDSPKYKTNRYKGFYITEENEIRIKELQMEFLKRKQRLDESDIINAAIEMFYNLTMSKGK